MPESTPAPQGHYPHPLDGHFKAFSSWARFQALRIRLDAIAPVEWSAQAREALAAAEADPQDHAMAEMALALSVAEWRRSPSRAEAACELSKFLALPTPEADDGTWNLICPLTGIGVVAAGFERAPLLAAAPASAFDELVGGEDPKQSAWARASGELAGGNVFDEFARRHHQVPGIFAGAAVARAMSTGEKPRHEIVPVAAAAKGPMNWTSTSKALQELGNMVHRRLAGDAGSLAKSLEKFSAASKATGDRFNQEEATRFRFFFEKVGKRAGRFSELLSSRDEDGNSLIDKLCHVATVQRIPQSWLTANPPQEVQSLHRFIAEAGARIEQHCRLLNNQRSGTMEWEDRSRGRQRHPMGGFDFRADGLMAEVCNDMLLLALAPLIGVQGKSGENELFYGFQTFMHIARRIAHGHLAYEGREVFETGMVADMLRSRLGRLSEALARGTVETMLFACPSEQGKAVPSLAAFASLPGELAMDAALLASDREAHWLERQGFPDEAAEMRLTQVGATANALALSESRKLLDSTSASATSEAKIMAMMTMLDGGRAAEAIRRHLAPFNIGTKQLSLFAQTPQGHGFMECLKALFDAQDGKLAVLDSATVLLLAFYRDAQDPAKDSYWKAPLAEGQAAALAKVVINGSQASNDLRNAIWDGGRVNCWSGAWGVFNSLPTADGLAYLSARADESARQMGILTRRGLDLLMGREPSEQEPVKSAGRFQCNGEDFNALPYHWLGDELAMGWGSLANLAGDGSSLEDEGFLAGLAKAKALGLAKAPRAKPRSSIAETLAIDDPVREILAEEGFTGKLALAAADARRMPHGLDSQAPARSQANAWLAEGKAAAKDWLGLSIGGARLAQTNDMVEAKVVAFCESRAERERKALAKGMASPVENARDREGRRWAEMLGEAAARGATATAAATTALAFKPGEFGSGDLMVSYESSIGACSRLMSGGIPFGEAIASLGRELDSSQALRARWQGAMLFRAQEILAADAAEPKKRTSKAAREEARAALALREDVSELGDWARALTGRFYAALPAKLDWARLAAGSQQWHLEVQTASVGTWSWDPIGLSWASADGVWTARELSSAASLAEEGAAMHHCVGSYAQHCLNGGSRVISILKNGERSSTLELSTRIMSENGRLARAPHSWEIKQNKAHCNKNPEPGAADAAKKIQAAAIAASADLARQASKEREVNTAKAAARAKGFGDLELPGFDAAAALARRAATAPSRAKDSDQSSRP